MPDGLFRIAIAAGFMAASSFAVAQQLVLSHEVGKPGAETSVAVEFSAGADDVEAISFSVNFDEAELGPADLILCGGGGTPSPGVSTSCSNPGNGTINVDVFASSPGNAIQTGSLGELVFTIPGGASAGVHSLTFSNVVFSDGRGDVVHGSADGGSVKLHRGKDKRPDRPSPDRR